MTLNEYIKKSDALTSFFFGRLHYIDGFSNSFLSGMPALKRSFFIQNQSFGLNIRVFQIVSLKDDRAYVVTYISPLNEYYKNLPIAQSMIDSLKITLARFENVVTGYVYHDRQQGTIPL